MRTIRVVLVEDSDLIRQGVESLLRQLAGIDVVATARSMSDAVIVIDQLRPDVALVDLGLPDGSGIELIRTAQQRWPDLRVIIVSSRQDTGAVRAAFVAGAWSYLFKSGSAANLEAAITAVFQGRRFIAPEVRDLLAEWATSPSAKGIERLSPRQMAVLMRVVNGETTKAIAASLGISVTTVNTHRAEILKRLGIRDLPTLTRFAIEQGLISAPLPPP